MGRQIRLALAGAVFAHEGVAPPMVADFHSAPATANEFQPLEGRYGSGRALERQWQWSRSAMMILPSKAGSFGDFTGGDALGAKQLGW